MKFRERLIALYREAAAASNFAGRVTVPQELRLGMRYFAPQIETSARDTTVTRETPTTGSAHSLTAVINTNEVDRYGTIVEPAGCRSENFTKNPVLLWAHGHDERVGMLPIGQVAALRISPAVIEADVDFDDEEPGAGFGRMYAAKKLRGFSIGFLPVSYAMEMRDDREVMRFLEWELVELSAVGVPANPSCLARDMAAGEFHFESRVVNDTFDLLCDCIATGNDPETLLCRVVDIEVPEAGAKTITTVAGAAPAAAAAPAKVHPTHYAGPTMPLETPESIAMRSVHEGDPLGLNALAGAQFELGGSPTPIPGATGSAASVAGGGAASPAGFTANRFAAAAITAPSAPIAAAPVAPVAQVIMPTAPQAAAPVVPAPAPVVRAPVAAAAPATCGCGGHSRSIEAIEPTGRRMALTPAERQLVAEGHGCTIGSCGHVAEQCRCGHGELIRTISDQPCQACAAPAAVRDLSGELDTLLQAPTLSPEMRSALTALRPTLVVVPSAVGPDWRGIWSTEIECRGANPAALPLMAAASLEIQGQVVRFFVHHRSADGALSVTGLQASMRELIGDSHDMTREALGEAYDHLAAHYKELGIICPEARPHSPGECYDLALRGIVTHCHAGQHFLFDRAEARTINGQPEMLPIFRSIETGQETAFQPPAIGRLTDHELWGRRDLPTPTGQEALLERLVESNERLIALQERVGAKFSQATKQRMSTIASTVGESCAQLRACADSMETVAREFTDLLGENTDTDRGVSPGGSNVAQVSAQAPAVGTEPVLDDEFVRNLSASVTSTLDTTARAIAMASRREARAKGVSALATT